MSGMEPKKLALLRILQILHQDSDEAHPMTQKQIGDRLERDYGIALERKAIGRNLALLKEAGIDVIDKSEDGPGCYLGERILEDSEIRLLIDSVLASKHISASNSRELIDKLCMLCSRHFKKHIKYIYAVDSWGKTKINNVLFYNIAQLDEAIAAGRQVCYQYNKFGPDKELHRSSDQVVSPYQMILHNQRYYLVAYSARWSSIVYHRMDPTRWSGFPALKTGSITAGFPPRCRICLPTGRNGSPSWPGQAMWTRWWTGSAMPAASRRGTGTPWRSAPRSARTPCCTGRCNMPRRWRSSPRPGSGKKSGRPCWRPYRNTADRNA